MYVYGLNIYESKKDEKFRDKKWFAVKIHRYKLISTQPSSIVQWDEIIPLDLGVRTLALHKKKTGCGYFSSSYSITRTFPTRPPAPFYD